MTGLTKSIAAMLLLLSALGLHADARVGSLAIETLLKDVVVGHYQAVAENRLEEAVRFYHSDSTEVARIRTEIKLSQAAYLQKTATLSFAFIGQREDLAFGKARHRFLRIAGMKFSEEFAEVSYVFRKEGGAWKLWMAWKMGRESQTSRAKQRADAWWIVRLVTEEKWSTNSGLPPPVCYAYF
jgi:hypothetical protein